MNTKTNALGTLFALLLAACSSTTTSPGQSPSNDNNDAKTDTTREAFSFVAPCTASACGDVPSSSSSPKPVCSSAEGECSWSDPDPSRSVSFRQCEEDECGAKPDASVCTNGTTFGGAVCGSENDGECVWRSTCVPPPSTTPCPDADGCGPKIEIGVVCKDGSTGDLECMKVGAKCAWQRTCD